MDPRRSLLVVLGDDRQLILTCTIPGGGDVDDESVGVANSLEWLP